jgi:hypothetical protein
MTEFRRSVPYSCVPSAPKTSVEKTCNRAPVTDFVYFCSKVLRNKDLF